MYVWQPEHKAILEHIQATDTLNSEWPLLRDIIKYKIDQNTALFLASPERPKPPPPFQPEPTASGGLKLPPFPLRNSSVPVPVNFMTPQQAAEMKQSVFELLDQFDSNPPFTIQRVCELCLHPRQNYTSVGKYLRAVEKALLVTSTHDSFPPLTESQKDTTIRTMTSIGGNPYPADPALLPDPIPPRRCPAIQIAQPAAFPTHPLETRALGLVDELDDPAPGHMSQHPVALTAVTTSDGDQFVDSLEARFVRAQDADAGGDGMFVEENKENSRT
ncbi:PPP4R2-domain-containing protein [Mycena metata]|uniref:PPP4R2-domain-containing protein n=1 Tax=Mycena metata TaxID=1033252 RepID=A0AAD7N932_9AGAR|nr:PPP4R2-domain-containing protein [Mycena metata]